MNAATTPAPGSADALLDDVVIAMARAAARHDHAREKAARTLAGTRPPGQALVPARQHAERR